MAWAAVDFIAESCFIACSAPAMAVSEIDSARLRLSVTALRAPPCPRMISAAWKEDASSRARATRRPEASLPSAPDNSLPDVCSCRNAPRTPEALLILSTILAVSADESW